MEGLDVLLLLVGLNLLSFLVMGIDKRRARLKKWRVPEQLLLLLAVIGGSAGIWSGIYVFRHKTQKPMFIFGVPLIIGLQVLVAILLTQRL
ncbi:MAG TPA: DUF1294 domain-containing protein [Bacillota bacterium]|nr:DUF1294 domain-containing protein [Bacillota bacterium]